MSDDTYYRIIQVKDDSQVRLTVNTFLDKDYISLREYYMDFDEEWRPTNKGITLPLTIPVTREIFAGLVEILSLEESKSILRDHFEDLLDEIYQL